MGELRPEEEWARQLLEQALGHSVLQHDDNSLDGMHDLEIRDGEDFIGAVEVTSAADGESMALWKLMNGEERWIAPHLQGGWMVALVPGARAKDVKRDLPDLLGELETRGLKEARLRRRSVSDPTLRRLLDLGVTNAHQSGTDYPGSIYPTVELPLDRMAGMVPQTGDPVARWISEFLAAPDRADVRGKLERSGRPQRHAVVIVPGLSTAPFGVIDLLMREDAPLPVASPSLPTEVTHLWAFSTWSSGVGMRWSPEGGWSHFHKRTDNI